MTNAIESIDFRGLPALRLRSPDGAQAIVASHGAHVLSWTPAGGGERIYLSERSAFESGKAIRGGIPVILPQFGTEGPLPRHGFARVLPWTLTEARDGADFSNATLSLHDSPLTRALWPYAFSAEVTIAVGAGRLDVELEIENGDEEAFSFTAALHTYLAVAEVEAARLEGLHGTRYRDQAAGGKQRVDTGEFLIVSDEVDRIYLGAPDTLLLREPTRSIGIYAEGFPDVVVWNPWEHKCKALEDMPANGFRRMLCVEAAVIGTPVLLTPGTQWWARQSLLAL